MSLYLSEDRILLGVCGTIAPSIGLDSKIVRLLFLAAVLFWGVGPFIYLITWIILKVINKK